MHNSVITKHTSMIHSLVRSYKTDDIESMLRIQKCRETAFQSGPAGATVSLGSFTGAVCDSILPLDIAVLHRHCARLSPYICSKVCFSWRPMSQLSHEAPLPGGFGSRWHWEDCPGAPHSAQWPCSSLSYNLGDFSFCLTKENKK